MSAGIWDLFSASWLLSAVGSLILSSSSSILARDFAVAWQTVAGGGPGGGGGSGGGGFGFLSNVSLFAGGVVVTKPGDLLVFV